MNYHLLPSGKHFTWFQVPAFFFFFFFFFFALVVEILTVGGLFLESMQLRNFKLLKALPQPKA